MFQYTTETIINSNVGKLASGKRFDVLDAAGESVIDWSGSTPAFISGKSASDVSMLLIDGVNAFRKANIDKVYRAVYRASKNAKAELTLGATGLTDGKIVRLTVAIREQGSVRSTIQNAYLHKNKPFHYELAVPEAGSLVSGSTDVEKDLVKALETLIKKDMAMTDFAFFKASVDGSNAKKLVLEADDCYIQFEDVKLEEVLEIENNATPIAAKLLGYNVTAPIANVSVSKTAGDEGQGTVARLVKNLRIPTNASINPFAADQGGKPVPGGQYDQFLIEYVTDRRHVSGTVMGSIGERSLTSHVLFMHQDVASAFNTILTLIGKTPEAAGRGDATGTGKGSNVTVTNGVPVLDEKKEMGSVE